MTSLRDEIRDTLHLAWPLIGAQMLSASALFVDSLFVARLGPAPLAAMAMSLGLLSALDIVCVGMLSSLSVFVSHLVGEGRTQAVGRTMRRGLVFALGLGTAVGAIMLASGPVLRLLGQDPVLIPMARDFLLALALGLPARLGYVALRQFSEGISDTRPSVVIAGAALALNAVLDYGLVFGNFGMPRLGLVGSALATALCQWLSFAVLVAYIRRSPRYQSYNVGAAGGDADVDDGHPIGEVLRVGLPLSGSLLAEMGFFSAATFVMGRFGVQSLASHQIALMAATFMFMMPLGLSFALAIRVSRARGAQDAAAMRRAARAGVIVTLALQAGTAAIFLFLPLRVVGLYTDDPALVPSAVAFVRVAGLFALFDGLQVVSMGLLRGLVDTRTPFAITTLSYWGIGMPALLALAGPLGLGPMGVWFGKVVALGMAALLLQRRLWRLLAA